MRVLKSGQAAKGEDILVEPRARAVETEFEGDAGEDDAAVDGAPAAAAPPLTGQDIGGMLDPAAAFVSKAEERAAQLLATAQSQAQALRQKADAEVAKLREDTQRELDARRNALEKELRAQLEGELRQRYSAALGALEGAASELRQRQEQYLTQIEQPALSLILALARQLIEGELSRSPRLIAVLIARAFELLKPGKVVNLYVNPATYHVLESDGLLVSALAEQGIRAERFELDIDETLKADQFVARSNGVSVDYDLSAALAEMLRHVAERASGAAAGDDPEPGADGQPQASLGAG